MQNSKNLMWREVLITFRLDHSYPWCYLLTAKLLGPRVLHPRPIDPKHGHNLQLTCTRPWERSSNPGRKNETYPWTMIIAVVKQVSQGFIFFIQKALLHNTELVVLQSDVQNLSWQRRVWPLPSWMGRRTLPNQPGFKGKMLRYVRISLIQIYHIYKHIGTS